MECAGCFGAISMTIVGLSHTGKETFNSRMPRAIKTSRDSRLRLKEKRDFVSALVDMAGTLAVVLDKEGQIVRFNQACQKLTGYSLDEVKGRHVWDLLLIPEEVESVKAIFRAVRDTGSPNRHESHWVSKDGSRRLIAWLNTSLPSQRGSVEFALSIGTDITDQRRAEENMRIYAELLTEAQEEERKRIARELHDETAQELSRLALDIDFLITTPKGLPEDMITHLVEFRRRIDSILQGVRRFSHNLRPSLLEDFGLLVALRWMTDNLTSRYMLSSSVEVVGTPRRLSPHTGLVLFRIAQEALNNVRKHSRAAKAQVRLKFSPESVTLSITDNGQGFAIPESLGDFVRLGRLGILGMQERARLVNGVFSVHSEIGQGTTVTVEVAE